MNNTFKITIIGGGTAGWLSALFLAKKIPNSIVTVVESSDIGILGAGEGTTPHFIDILNQVDIPFRDLFKHAKATIKQGIKFTNWHGDGTSYFHPFFDGDYNFHKVPFLAEYCVSNNINLDTVCVSHLSSDQNKTKFYFQDNAVTPMGAFALHFDAKLLAAFLKNVAISRGIKHIDSKVQNLETDADGNINQIILTNGVVNKPDFVFDCTGFSRLIIGNFYKSQWLDCSKHLPAKKAFAFFIGHDNNIPSHTEAISMKYGWAWKIPVQDRYGCGYVYDSDFISDEEAKQEVLHYFGNDIEPGKTFEFRPGFYPKSWEKNCVALGLSSGFVEPLEATSLWVLVDSLIILVEQFLPGVIYQENREYYTEQYNAHVARINNDIVDFLYLHYVSQRSDTDFWKNFVKNNTPTEKTSKLLDIKNLNNYFFKRHFATFNFPQVKVGMRIIDSEIVKKELSLYINFETQKDDVEKFISDINNFVDLRAIDHKRLISFFKR